MKKKYDLVVVGGGTSGCAAAYTAANAGLSVLLIEKSGALGGSMTEGLVVPAMKSTLNNLNTSFYELLVDKMRQYDGQISYLGNPGWFNPELLKIALDELMIKSGADVLFNTTIHRINLTERNITSITLYKEILSGYNDELQNLDKQLSVNIGARYVVDATGNCEIGKILNCKFLKNDKREQPFSLRFIMSNVNLETFSDWLLGVDSDRNVTTVEHIDGNIHLSTAYTWDTDKKWALEPVFSAALNDGVLKETDINYFQVFTIPGMLGSIAFNCPRLVDLCSDITVENTTKALISARCAIYRISKFCRQYFPGFENAYISNISDMLGIRSSRRIKGKYVFTINDIKNGQKFKNPVAIANYPIDVHSRKKNKSTLKNVGEYQIPVEALMSEDIENLFVAGRCISCDFMAQGAIRVQPTCFAMGEGVAKYIKTLIDA